MKIYTRTGDDGTTGLFGGQRVAKDDLRIEAYGGIDELNAALGVARAQMLPLTIDDAVAALQHELFVLGAELASPSGMPRGLEPLGVGEIEALERSIDQFESELPPLRVFILPGGGPSAAALHAARCTCRRAERQLVALARHTAVRPEAIQYLNRVGDLLFVLARAANVAEGRNDIPWKH
ncbi:MAG TPA: cob(I)yrinic acid a,c-diamide adenosyltransferase [Lacipirellulaceae bacterium]|nr:cob(I)yrinic acid a,c-diamide adenosyltransferase [Lacipirellulaceae bacterium]